MQTEKKILLICKKALIIMDNLTKPYFSQYKTKVNRRDQIKKDILDQKKIVSINAN